MQFKVYDFGFYLHQENTTGGYPEPFAQKITEVQDSSPYYLLFGKQTDNSGVNTKFWVDLVLPDTGEFRCLDLISTSLRSDLTNKFQIVANFVHIENEQDANKYFIAEISAMQSLHSYLLSMINCCDANRAARPSCTGCVYNNTEMGQYLLSQGFNGSQSQKKLGEIVSVGISPDVIGRTNMILEIDGESIEIDKQISGIAERYVLNNPNKSIKIYLKTFGSLCGFFDNAFRACLKISYFRPVDSPNNHRNIGQ